MKLRKIVINLIMFMISFLFIWPFYEIFVMGTYPSERLYQGAVFWFGSFYVENLKTVFSAPYLRYYWNSTYIAALNSVGIVLVSSMAGYGFSKYQFKFSKIGYAFVLALLVVPGQLSLVGYVMEMKSLGWLNTHLPLIVQIASPFGVMWMTSYMKDGFPSAIQEAARIDGSSEIGIYFRMVLPICKPALGTLLLLTFLWSWNSYLLPMIIINKQEMYTLPVGISNFGNQYRLDLGAQLAAVGLSILPVVTVFSIFNKTLIRGITAGAVKM